MYQTIAAGQTDVALGSDSTGKSGDWIGRLICVVATAATSQVSIKDGTGSAIVILPNAVGGGVGTYPIAVDMEARTTGGWTITTAAGVSVIAQGRFSNS